MRTHRYVIVDVFTDQPLAGNQLAVFTDASDVPERLLQPIAREINFSETVFCYPDEGPDDGARVRIFTPAQELRFVGHPVLGTGAVLAARDGGAVGLETGAGLVPVRMDALDGARRFGWMTQPVPTVEPVADPGPLLEALGVGEPIAPVDQYDNGVAHVFVAVGEDDTVAALAPDLRAVAALFPDAGVSCFAGEGSRWTTRMFAPGLGVAEDPTTGSAAGPLAVHAGRHGLAPFGTELVISQGAGLLRPSTLHARADGTRDKVERVEVGGSVVVVGRGELDLPR